MIVSAITSVICGAFITLAGVLGPSDLPDIPHKGCKAHIIQGGLTLWGIGSILSGLDQIILLFL